MKPTRNRKAHRSSGTGPRKSGPQKSGPQKAGNQKTGKPTKLRIIGGDMRGRIILYHGAEFTRPMKDNIRENLFNILGRSVHGSICFDLFAGTGAMAFESLSRGAVSAVLVEQNRRAVSYIHKTAESIDVESKIRVVTGNTFHLASTLLAAPQDDTPWIVFLCPPYALWQESLPELNAIIQTTLEQAPLGSVLMAETETSFDVTQLPAGDWDFREYGGTRLAFIEPTMQCGMNL